MSKSRRRDLLITPYSLLLQNHFPAHRMVEGLLRQFVLVLELSENRADNSRSTRKILIKPARKSMNKSVNFVFGTIVGIALGALAGYILAPARETSFDQSYQSRLDKALEEGRKAAAAREAELREEFKQSKRRNTPGEESI
jgi:hypothetical protein